MKFAPIAVFCVFLFSCSSPTPSVADEPGNAPPVVISTWDAGEAANAEALRALAAGGTALDAVEAGVRLAEADTTNKYVGAGGLPDRDGFVTLDASIMDWAGNAGSVVFLENIVHPISVARRVMEETPHVILAGAGARQFALEQGFAATDLLTEQARREWMEWRKTAEYRPVINAENHDTIGQLVLDEEGRIAGACTTSGMAYKMRGRVGDSPIIGAGLFVDGEVGGAVATGLGEAVLRTLTSFLVVEFMRQGMTPQEACEAAIQRLKEKHDNHRDFQIGIVALDVKGRTGAYALQPGFNFARSVDGTTELIDAASIGGN